MKVNVAREYIEQFRKHTLQGAEYVDFPSGRIYLDNMTDEEAIKVSYALKEIEYEASKLSVKQ